MINADIKQLEDLTLGKIAELTEKSEGLLKNMKFFKNGIKKVEEEIEIILAQDILDSCDTKIKVNLR